MWCMNLSSPSKRWKKSDACWLAIAVVAHLALLLVPLKQPVPDTHDQLLISISLKAFVEDSHSEPVKKPQEDSEDLAEPEVVPVDDAEPDIATVEKMDQIAPIESSPDETEEEVLPSAAQLIESISSVHTEQSEPATTRLLGSSFSVSTPPNWRAGTGTGAARYIDNWFEGMAVPRSTEVVDRWRSNDGSQNAVVNLPNGTTMCGRRAPSDPLRPMVENLMMFRPCGGGGKRTFSMDRSKIRSNMASMSR